MLCSGTLNAWGLAQIKAEVFPVFPSGRTLRQGVVSSAGTSAWSPAAAERCRHRRGTQWEDANDTSHRVLGSDRNRDTVKAVGVPGPWTINVIDAFGINALQQEGGALPEREEGRRVSVLRNQKERITSREQPQSASTCMAHCVDFLRAGFWAHELLTKTLYRVEPMTPSPRKWRRGDTQVDQRIGHILILYI